MVRLKHRWIVGQILFEPGDTVQDFSSQDIQNAVREKINLLYGDMGMGMIPSSLVRFYDAESHFFVVRTLRETLQNVWFALSCVTSVMKKNTTLRVLRVAGSSKTCTSYLRDMFPKITTKENLSETDLGKRKHVFMSQLDNI
mmetsp:Transcript_34600/g.35281  ORF Transcript_34600/g.35281 Transcript_34600/m.35281 type:complete len:142 (+) Transcript_34600:136-561(+)